MHPLDDEVEDYPDDEYDETAADYDGYGDALWPSDRRWRATAVVGVVLALGAIATAVVINSGDSASTKATIGPTAARTPVISTTPRLTAPPSASTSPSPLPSTSPSLHPQLPPETIVTLTPSTLPGLAPPRTPTAAPAPTAIPPSVTVNPRTVVYSVTGTKELFDLVNIVYTDAQGYPRTEFNVALPWTKVVVLNPGVQTQSVIATSIYSRLNCAVVNAAGQPVATSVKNSNLATCTR